MLILPNSQRLRIQLNLIMYDLNSFEINGFSQVLKKALQVQDSIVNYNMKFHDIPKVSKGLKVTLLVKQTYIIYQSFQEIAETLISQLEYLKGKGFLPNMGGTNEDIILTTINTQAASEDIQQLHEIITQKDQMVEMLTKEKNYYMKRSEQAQKTVP